MADKILIKSAGAMKELFVNRLTAFAGKEYEQSGMKKIETIGAFTGTEDLKENRKTAHRRTELDKCRRNRKNTFILHW
ncbi:MAG: hypothetical protein ACLRWA_06375 [Lachnospira sp.]